MKALISFMTLLTAGVCMAQCGPFRGHPIWPDTLGVAYVNPDECWNDVDACLWDNGSTAWFANGLSVGTHSVVLYSNGIAVLTLSFEIEQLHWNLNQWVVPYADGLAVSTGAEVPYCGTSIFNNHRCPPDPDQTVLYLLQDGVAIDSLSPVTCLGTQHLWEALPFGHTYQLHLLDRSSCGSEAWGPAIETWSCSGAEVILQVQPSTGTTGSIEVQAVVPNPASIHPPPGPVSGRFRLFTLPANQLIGEQTGTMAYWDDLPPGDYEVLFIPDVLCDLVHTSVTVGLVSGLTDHTMVAPRPWPIPAHDMLRLGTMVKRVQVTDLHGRLLVQAWNTDRIAVEALAPGCYLLLMEGRSAMHFAKD